MALLLVPLLPATGVLSVTMAPMQANQQVVAPAESAPQVAAPVAAPVEAPAAAELPAQASSETPAAK
ncbi:hypothetical protein D3C86_2094060 [compost metagenome]